jgi:putative transposase
MVEEHQVSERQACKVLCLPRSTYRYRHRIKHDEPVISELNQLVDKHPSIGFWIVITEYASKGSYGIINVFTEYILRCN